MAKKHYTITYISYKYTPEILFVNCQYFEECCMKKSIIICLSAFLAVVFLVSACKSKNAHSSPPKKNFNLNNLAGFANIIPVAILGSGPAGTAAGVYVGRAGFSSVTFEGDLPGGLLTRTSIVENWPGNIEIMGPDLMAGLKKQAKKWGTTFVFDTVESVDFTKWPFKLKTAEGHEVHALTVILATGATPRYLGVPGEKEFWGRGVTTCAVCDAPFYKGEHVVVVGGGDSAAEEAIQLAPYAKHITILVRADKMRASLAMQNRLKEFPHISIRYNVQIKEIIGNDVQVTGVTLYDSKKEVTEHMAISGVFLAIGHIPNTEFLNGAVTLDPSGHIHLADRTQQTSVQGVFAAGDVADDRYRQAGVSAGHGIAAALDATFFLNEIGFNEQHQSEITRTHRLYKPEVEDAYEVEEINDPEIFSKVLADDKPTLVDFYAEWCPSCMQMLPSYSAVARDMHERINFVKVDADSGSAIMKACSVERIPTLLVYKKGVLVKKFSDVMTKQELHALAESLLVD